MEDVVRYMTHTVLQPSRVVQSDGTGYPGQPISFTLESSRPLILGNLVKIRFQRDVVSDSLYVPLLTRPVSSLQHWAGALASLKRI